MLSYYQLGTGERDCSSVRQNKRMTNFRFLESSAIVSLLGIGMAGISRASVTACSSTPNGTAISAYTGAANGCSAVDMSYTNLTVTGASSSGGAPTPSTANIAAYSSGDTGASGNTAGPVNILFDGNGVTDNWSLSGLLSQNQGFTINYAANANTGGAYTGGTYPTPTGANLHWTISGLLLTSTNTIVCNGPLGCLPNAQQIVITETFCIGAATTAGCAPADFGTINATITGVAGSTTGQVTTAFVCTFASGGCVSSTGNQINFTAGELSTLQTNGIAISDAVTITRTLGLDLATVTLTNLENQFDQLAEAPEPSTFILVGFALAAVAILRFRKRNSNPA
jgi:hypothetical protein